MNLETLLPAIRSLDHLPALVAALGHQPLGDQIPSDESRARTPKASPITVIGQTADLPWFAIQAPNPEPSAKALARRMIKRGRPCLVFALEPETRRLAIAVALDECPSLELNLATPGPEVLATLLRLGADSEGGALAFVSRASDALGAETAGRRFFREFRNTLERMSEGLPGTVPPQDRHNLALLQLTRILFLYFIQSKGWLGGRARFMAEEIDRCLRHRRRIHRDLLRPLFFGTLNCPQARRTKAAAAFGAIPFLNGGLFEPHPLEHRFPTDIPNNLWRTAFDGLFERFHFTVSEGEWNGGVAPDMLGRVFEGVMAPEARHASGTFYTPSRWVGRVLDAALTAVLASRLGCGEGEAERRLADPDAGATAVLEGLTLLDPAVGSGAFLLGALERLAQVARGPGASIRKRRVLQRNLFGVDQSAAAVRLTELRLWLSVIAEDPAEDARQVSPLPNLDCLIRQGDSLFDPIHQSSEPSVQQSAPAGELPALRQALITASGTEKRALVRRLRMVEAHLVAQSLLLAEERNRAATAQCLSQARGSDLFGKRRGVDRELQGRLDQLRSQGRFLRASRKRLASEGEVPWFHYQSHFADVFAAGGFDLVVGNPPWLRSEEIPPTVRQRLAGRYRWWRSGGRGYANKPDLAVAFIERSLELTAPAGVVVMLVPAKIASAGYAAAARHELASITTMNAIVDLTADAGADFEATVYPMALVTTKVRPAPQHRVRTRLETGSVEGLGQTRLAGGGPWILTTDSLQNVLADLQARHPPLGQSFVCQLGLKTGANRIFLDPPDGLERTLLRWAVRGRDVTAFRCAPVARLLWTHDVRGLPRTQLPPVGAAYLAEHESELRARRDYNSGPVWTVFRARAATGRYRVVWSDLARDLVAAALTSRRDLQLIPLNSCYVIAARSAQAAELVTACLNSTWLRAAARLTAVPAAGGFSRFNARVISGLPLPTSAVTDPLMPELARAGRKGSDVQREIDERMAEHLGLSPTAQHALRTVVGSAAGDRR
jgi:Eco57I restriction-modification methylase